MEIESNLETFLPLSKLIRLLWITKCKRKASLPRSATLKERRMFLSEPPWLSWLMMKLISLLLLTGVKIVLLMLPLFNKKLFKLLPLKLLLPRLTILGTYSLRCLTSHLLWKLVTLKLGAKKLEIVSPPVMCYALLRQTKLLWITKCKKKVTLLRFYSLLEKRMSLSVKLLLFSLKTKKILLPLKTGLLKDPSLLLLLHPYRLKPHLPLSLLETNPLLP